MYDKALFSNKPHVFILFIILLTTSLLLSSCSNDDSSTPSNTTTSTDDESSTSTDNPETTPSSTLCTGNPSSSPVEVAVDSDCSQTASAGINYYKFQSSANGEFTVRAYNKTESSNFDFGIYSDSGYSTAIKTCVATQSGTEETCTFNVSSGVTYYFIVQNKGSAAVSYTLQVAGTTTASISSYCKGNASSVAVEIKPASDCSQSLVSGFNYYTFKTFASSFTNNATQYTIEANNKASNTNVDFGVYSDSNFNNTITTCTDTSSGTGEACSFSISPETTYYFIIDNKESSSVSATLQVHW